MTLSASVRPAAPPALVILIGILAMSTASIFIRYAQAEAHSLVIAAYRLVLASLILVPAALTRHRAEIRSLRRGELLLAVGSGFFLAIHFATWITSLAYTSVISSLVFVQTSPIWVALAAPIFLKESIRPNVYWGLGLAIAGGIVVSYGDRCIIDGFRLVCDTTGPAAGSRVALGNFLALCGAWSSAAYLIIGRRLRARLSLITYIAVVYSSAAVFLVITMFAFGHSPTGYSGTTYLWFLLLAIVPQLLGHSSFNWALGFLPASIVAVALLGEPIGSAVLAAILLAELPTMVKLIGAAMILIGIVVVSRRKPSVKKG